VPDQDNKDAVIGLKKFLEAIPPGRWAKVAAMATKMGSQYGFYYQMALPELELHCSTPPCDGVRFFEPEGEFYPKLQPKARQEAFITYRCRNCRGTAKTYALLACLSEDENNGEMYKLGEYPSFGPPTPARLISLIGPEKEYFLKGRRAENQGLGIAAFAYYRRVIESQKNRILDEIIKVSEKVSAPKEVLEDLSRAKQETQFSKAVDAVKHGVPQMLLINGHNPLTRLHSALGEGLHAQTDEQCLELATSIRVVMAELAERLAQAFKDEVELSAALGRLMGASSPKKQSPDVGG